jgi:hypothetical protein
MNASDFPVGSRVRLLRYAATFTPADNVYGTVTGYGGKYSYVIVDFSENKGEPYPSNADDLPCLPSELELVVAKTQEKSGTVIYNGDDLARISKTYNALDNVLTLQGVDTIAATVSDLNGDYILADFRVEDGALVADLSRYGQSL